MKKLKIIFVDNDEDEQLFMKEGFEASGLFEVIYQANDGSDLFEFLQEKNTTLPDVILSDLNMPGKSGYDILVEIPGNNMYGQIPVIITSTSSTQSVIDRCMAMGAAAYLVKPETFAEYQSFARQLHAMIQDRGLVR
jgi:CheY-like chemotaxis protein